MNKQTYTYCTHMTSLAVKFLIFFPSDMIRNSGLHLNSQEGAEYLKFKFLQPGLLHWHKRDGNSEEHMLRGTYVWSMCFNARGEREEEGGGHR